MKNRNSQMYKCLLVFIVVWAGISVCFFLCTKSTNVAQEFSDSIDTLSINNMAAKYSGYIKNNGSDSLALVIHEYEESVRKIQRESAERVRQQIESVNTNISIWMAIIAGICTLLPMASSLYQLSLLDKMEGHRNEERKEFENMTKKARSEVQKETNIILKKIKDYEDDIEKTRLIPTLSLLESNIKIICDLQDFQLKNRMSLVNDVYVNNLLDSICKLSDNSKTLLEKVIGTLRYPELEQVRMSIHNAYVSLSGLSMTLQSVAVEETLFQVLTLSDKLRIESIRFVNERHACTFDQNKEISQAMCNIDIHLQSIRDIIKEIRKAD